MFTKLKFPLIILITIGTIVFISLYSFHSFQKITQTTVTNMSKSIPLLNFQDTITTLTPNYNNNVNEFLIQTSDHSATTTEHIFINDATQAISYTVLQLQTKPVRSIIVGVVNDKAITSLHYEDHVGATGIVSFLIDDNVNNNGLSAVEKYPQLFVIKTPFVKGILIGKNTTGNDVFLENIIRN